MLRLTKLSLFTICLLALLSACGSKTLRGKRPLLSVNTLNINQQPYQLQLSINNINNEPLQLLGIEYTLSLEQQKSSLQTAILDSSVDAKGTETITLNLLLEPTMLRRLEDLGGDSSATIAYRLDGFINTAVDTKGRISARGQLYPVPGKPGLFR